ncbi:MAG: tRNA (cytidine(34)-2'-O)-methyltransferase [Candidatus Delongbacteria bacterium]|nr:tRNA (cytidine(34)-2'-O)-methyltransferase [Candidatus Delongbacteria bacterium]MBN2835677.1 tRNA (cytidine(34)-2'-O)-methyltransferase [Candidatus Delongbacteria bacterium]
MKSWLNIVLFEPEIPQNTGNIGRLCVGLEIKLHLIEPLGFKITEKAIRRTGLDYWSDLDYQTYSSWDDFLEKCNPEKVFYASTKGQKEFYDLDFTEDSFIVFGKESAGLPAWFHEKYGLNGFKIPMPGKIRSINLSNSVSVVAYEAFRQIKYRKS